MNVHLVKWGQLGFAYKLVILAVMGEGEMRAMGGTGALSERGFLFGRKRGESRERAESRASIARRHGRGSAGRGQQGAPQAASWAAEPRDPGGREGWRDGRTDGQTDRAALGHAAHPGFPTHSHARCAKLSRRSARALPRP